jgi:ADP-heptose:LPS heptosyltransferase
MIFYGILNPIMLNPKRILVTKFRAMGDTILLTAALKELHRQFPQAQIHAAVTEPWIWLLEGFPGVTKLLPVTWHQDRAARTKAATRLAFQLRKEKYDIVCGFHSSPAAAMVGLSTGAKIRSIHFHSFKAKNMYSTVQIPGKGTMKPVVERDLDTVRALGLDVPEGIMPEIFLKNEEKAFAREEFKAWGLKRPVLGIALGASRPTKIWPLHRFAEVAQKWVNETQGSVLVISGPKEESLTEEFYRSISSSPDLRPSIQVMPSCNVRVLASRISQLNALVGNDSGPRHLAAALNVPTVTIFGPEHPLEWHPYPQDRHPRLFLEPLPCRANHEPGSPPWCGIQDCIIESHQCMTKISAEQVDEQLARVYREYGKDLGI